MAELSKLFVVIGAKTDEFEKSLDKMKISLDKIGTGMMVAGGLIAAGLGAAFKAAESERVNIVKLGQALKNVGVNYDDIAENLENVISLTQRKTGIGDDKQRDSLRALITTTGDYKKSLELLPLALDLAVAKDMDAVTAAELLGRVLQGNVSMLTRYGIVIREGATSSEALAEIQKRVGGAAEAALSPIQSLQASMGDLAESIGGSLVPVINDLLQNNIIPFVNKLGEWIKTNPEVVKSAVVLAGALLAGGGLIWAFTSLSKAIVAVNTALIVLQSLTGAGILKVIAGLAVAGAGVFAMNKLMEGSGSIPAHASGGYFTTPHLAMIAENGPEAVLNEQQLGYMGGTSLTLNVGNYMGDDMSRRELVRDIQQILNEENRRSVSPSTKTQYYSVGGHL
jgi:hypothetical protein